MERTPYQKSQSEDVASTARHAAEQVREKAQELGHRAMDQAKSTAESAKQRAESMADEGCNRLAGRMEGVARALRQTATAMNDDENGDLSNITNQLGSQVEKMSSWLKDHDTRDVIWRVENFARRQPAVFLGGAFVIGLAAARFLKSSSSRERDYGYDTDVSSPELGRPDYYGEYEKVRPQPTIPVTGQSGSQAMISPADYSQASGVQSGMPGAPSTIRRP